MMQHYGFSWKELTGENQVSLRDWILIRQSLQLDLARARPNQEGTYRAPGGNMVRRTPI
jgi:hypothetical protein